MQLSRKSASVGELCSALQKNPHQEGKLDKLFHQLDKDGNGTLDSSEFMKFVKELMNIDVENTHGVEGYLKSVFDEVDTNSDGVVTKEELLEYFVKTHARYSSAPTIVLIDGSIAKVFREASSFLFASGSLHILIKGSRNTTSKRIDLGSGRAVMLHTDHGYGAFSTKYTQKGKNDSSLVN
eukprot:TRINITY_DN491_c0_g1_i1.p1 TRINITY_DN491_c0_g1~~TRINITY_DN491_c0_g1_i1.p1  ORF type:complete len:181 (-),score=28.63 TRINITY_DN491_c0_g1_i1:796-1338(-)